MTSSKQPCERIVGEVLPVIRAKLAMVIIQEYCLSQTATAQLLGVTQAAVSQYTTGRRADEDVLAGNPTIEEEIDVLAKRLVEGLEAGEREKLFCGLCRMCQTLPYDSDDR